MKSIIVALCLSASIGIGAAQVAGIQTSPPPRPKRVNPKWPVRDVHTPGYVKATELPDGMVPPPDVDGNFILGPTHPPAPELNPPAKELRGSVITFTMTSADSKIYPGIGREPGTHGTFDPQDPAKMIVTTSHAMPYTRNVAVYVPKEYVPGTVAPFIVGADGPDKLLFAALDKLIGEDKLPPMIAVSIANGSDEHKNGDGQGSERGLEYDTVSGRYAEFVESEVLPRVEAEAHVKLSKDPEGRATMGGSSGGAAAFSMAWFHPEWYHRVLTYSGTYVNQQWPYNPETPHGAWNYHETIIPNSARKPLRIWLEVADQDMYNYGGMADGYHDWTLANEDMAKVLAEKGYHYQFLFAHNAGHVDGAVKRQTLPEALEYIWQGYKPVTR
jgi:enterochelin esterase family protein